jgi:hypothetical protein
MLYREMGKVLYMLYWHFGGHLGGTSPTDFLKNTAEWLSHTTPQRHGKGHGIQYSASLYNYSPSQTAIFTKESEIRLLWSQMDNVGYCKQSQPANRLFRVESIRSTQGTPSVSEESYQ